ncbi:MAG TPA: hypothetical protein VH572_09510 [Gaiella sp.]|jgi:hypothetical protein
MNAAVESARREWEEGYRRFREEARDPARSEILHQQLEAVTDELRRRIGGVYTLDELARAYESAERWSRVAVAERAPSPGWARTLALVEDSAFHLYSRGAVDYEP